MMESGWIFPDGTEYVCGGDNLVIHALAVKKFIRGLRFQDLEVKKRIEKEIDDFYWQHGSLNLYLNYAINRLGWIKVGSSIWHDIQYAGYDWQPDLVKPYEEIGYQLKNRLLSSSSFLPVNCDILLAIRNGEEHYHSSGEEYRYDGTDEDDTYVDKNGQFCIAPWSKTTT